MEVNIKFTIKDETVSEVIKEVKDFHNLDMSEKQALALIKSELKLRGEHFLYGYDIENISKLNMLKCCGISTDEYFHTKKKKYEKYIRFV